MSVQDWLTAIWVGGAVVWCIVGWVSIARHNTSSDLAGVVLLTCLFWPAVFVIGVPQYLWLLIRYRSFRIAGEEVLR